jgi:cysteine desulfurase/selenocysteine lyase
MVKKYSFGHAPAMTNDLEIKNDFPLLAAQPTLAFLDNAATTHKPAVVIDAEAQVYRAAYANIHRAVYDLAETATQQFEDARARVAAFIGAAAPQEIIFTSNASAALNLAAHIEGQRIQAGDELLISIAAHHSNVLPWMRLATARGAKIVWIEVNKEGRLDIDDMRKKISACTKVVAVAHVSNVLGDVAPIADICAAAHAVGAHVVVDGAQSSCRMLIDVQALGADYMAFSAHKMYGPTGVGWLWAKGQLLEGAEPLNAGGGTIKTVSREKIEWADVPWRFEAGTPDIAGVIALHALFDYLEQVGMDNVWQHDQALLEYLLQKLSAVEGIQIYGATDTRDRAALISFTYSVAGKVIHPHDVAQLCNTDNVAIRGGHHCAQPLMQTLGVDALNRVSAGMYTTAADVDQLVGALAHIAEKFA